MTTSGLFTWNEEVTRKVEVPDGGVFPKALKNHQSQVWAPEAGPTLR